VRRAFSAIELTIVVGILSVLSAIAMPAVTRLLDRVRVRAAVTEIESLFAAARHAAIARGTPANVEIDTVARTILVTMDRDTVRKGLLGAEHGVELATNRRSMTYSASGVGYGAANLSVVVRKSAAADTVVVSRLGRVRH
jgi:prepilin-type N-terminal cleavage/methylation domain-containing protein